MMGQDLSAPCLQQSEPADFVVCENKVFSAPSSAFILRTYGCRNLPRHDVGMSWNGQLLALLLVLASCPSHSQLLRGSTPCLPASIPAEQQCNYVQHLNPSCREKQDGFLNYLELCYCYLPAWPLFRVSVFVLWVVVLFTLLMVVAER